MAVKHTRIIISITIQTPWKLYGDDEATTGSITTCTAVKDSSQQAKFYIIITLTVQRKLLGLDRSFSTWLHGSGNHRPPGRTYSHLAHQEIHHLKWKLMVHNSILPVPTLSWKDVVNTFMSYLIKTNFNIILSSFRFISSG